MSVNISKVLAFALGAGFTSDRQINMDQQWTCDLNLKIVINSILGPSLKEKNDIEES